MGRRPPSSAPCASAEPRSSSHPHVPEVPQSPPAQHSAHPAAQLRGMVAESVSSRLRDMKAVTVTQRVIYLHCAA